MTPTIGTLSALNYTFTNFANDALTIGKSQAKPVKHRPAGSRSRSSGQWCAIEDGVPGCSQG